MSAKVIRPDAILAMSNMSGSVTDIDEPVDAPDSSYVLRNGTSGSTTCRVSFPSIGSNLTVGAGLQKFRVWMRNPDSAAHTLSLAVYEGGTSKAVSGTFTVLGSAPGLAEFTWNASLLADVSGANVECLVSQSAPNLDIGAIEWVADVVPIALTAAALAVGSPVRGSPALKAGYLLTAVWPPRSPVIGFGILGQKHKLLPVTLAVGPLEFTFPGLRKLTAASFAVASLDLGRPGLKVPHPWVSLPTLSSQLNEADDLLNRALDALVGAVPGRNTGRNSWDFRRAVGSIRAKGEALIKAGTLGPPAIEAWEAARVAGATFDTLDMARGIMLAERPQSVPAQAVAHLTVQLTLVQMSRITAATEFVSRDQASKAMTRLAAAFEPAEEDIADEDDSMCYRAIVGLRAAAVRDLAERGRQLPRVVKFSFASAMPAPWIANRIYGDASRTDQLHAENRWIHPAFAPPDGICLSR